MKSPKPSPVIGLKRCTRPFPSIPALLATLTGAALLAVSAQTAHADVIFTDPFATSNSGWDNNGNFPATWGTVGGLTGDGDGYIAAQAILSSGAVVLRGQTNQGASPGLFGNWTSTGTFPLSVVTLSLDLYQDSGSVQNFGLRFATAAGFPGAFYTGSISIPTGVWTHVDVPINDTVFSFPEGGGDYPSTFSAIARVQLSISGTPSSAFNVRLDNPTISTVPEPGSVALLGMTAGFGLSMRRRRN